MDERHDPNGDGPSAVPVLESIEGVLAVVSTARRPVFVRFSTTEPHSADEPSVDHESGLELPGLSVNPLNPPAWWRGRSLEEWVVRRICTYAHLQHREPDRSCWVVQGEIVDRGPDNEPLIVPDRVLAKIARTVVAECMDRRVRAGLESTGAREGPPWQTSPPRS
jgi:hypothetical protein